jgi:hypothetical protein
VTRRVTVSLIRALLAAPVLSVSSGVALAQPLRVTATSAMDFGTLSPLVVKTIAPSAGTAGVFTIQGPASATIAVLVVTPEQLLGTSQYVRTASWVATVTTQFGTSPSAVPLVMGSELSIALGTDGLAVLRIGATMTPPMTVGSGAFSGVMTVVARQASAGLMSLTAQTTVSATVRQPMILTAVPMDFGPVYVATPKTLAPTDVNAFKLLVDGALGATVEVTLESAPTVLSHSGGSTMTIGSWLARSGGASCSGSAATPIVGAPVSLDLTAVVGASGRTSYCLGATVSPTALQTPGNYTGTVLVSVRYTGA